MVKIDAHPFYGTHIKCDTCGHNGVVADEDTKRRDVIIKGLIKTVSAKSKKWGM